jgi:prepilin-type N-terminal cleavage/methylation domain-containing protein
MTRLRDERGFTLVELLVGMQLMLIVMFAALMTLEQVTKMGKRNERSVDMQEQARQATREMSRALRNVAAAVDTADAVVRAQPYDLVVRSVDDTGAASSTNDRRLEWLRYCLDSSDPSRGRIYRQSTGAAAAAMPTGTACPASDWGAARQIADRVTNRANGASRPVWSYRLSVGRVSSVSIALWLDDDPLSAPGETSVTTGVFLRNQNRPPVASFSATPAGVRHVLLNATTSYDPEGQPLDVVWRDGGVQVGDGLIFDYRAPASGARRITLEVKDPSALSDSTEQTVVIP